MVIDFGTKFDYTK